MLNLELLQQVRDKIMFEPEQHKQDVWMTVGKGLPEGTRVACPTAACVAGWACLMSGDVGYVEDEAIESGYAMVYSVLTPDGEIMEVSERGMALLGLDYDEGDELFDPENSREFVLDKLDELIVRAKEERNL